MNAKTILCLLVLLAAGPVFAAPPVSDDAKKPTTVTAAVLDYEVSMPGNKQLGVQIAEILTVRLSMVDGIDLVERAKMGKILAEQKLKLVGLVDQKKAVKVGKLFGAQLLIMGKGFVMDKKLTIVTKVVGVETGLVKGRITEVELNKPISEMIKLLSDDIAAVIRKNASKLLPEAAPLVDPIKQLRKKLGKAKPFTLAIVVPEEHRRRRVPVVVLDPAVETEIKRMLIACGFKVVDTGKNELADWAKELLKDQKKPWPAALNQADYVVVGEAFSQFAARTGDLVTCAARAETNLIERSTGRIVLAGRQTERAVDLAEEIAGKTALQKAGHKLGLEICRELVERALRAAKAAKAAPKLPKKGAKK